MIARIPKDSTKPATTYSYNSKNQLVRVQVTSSALGPVSKYIAYSYDVLGRRMEKKITDLVDSNKSYSRRFVYDGDNILFEYDGDSNMVATYTHSTLAADEVLSVNITSSGVTAGLATAPGHFYYLKDALGSATEVIEASGSLVQKYDYSSFGKIISIKDGNGTDISPRPALKTSSTFTGREWDEEAGLYYYRARTYDPQIGRFLQVDSDSGNGTDPVTIVNKYGYVKNNPTSLVDPSGNFSIFGIEVGRYEFAAFVAGAFRPLFDIARANIPDADRRRLDNAVIFTGAVTVTAGIAPATAAVSVGVTAYQNRNNAEGNFFDNLDGYTRDYVTNFAVSYLIFQGASDLKGSANLIPFAGPSMSAVAVSSIRGIATVHLKEYLCHNVSKIPNGLGKDLIGGIGLIADRGGTCSE